MSGYGKENQCRNFAPNIFNKNKCQNCFKPRETHLLSDKDLNKATPIYVGWLLLAPIGTDFDNPTHRARKWQRRYFILFEHGALRYALDDNANTLPQGTINMNQCTDVVHADPITGQKYSLCIYHPEMKYFIRSESRDDTTGWYDQLIIFPQTVKQDALNKKRFARRFGSAKAATSPADDTNRKPSVTYDELRSPKSETPPPLERITSPEPYDKKPNSEIKRGRSISRKSTDKKQGTQTSDAQRPLRRAKSLDRESHDLNDNITIESLNQRKGWILKRRNSTKETWTKHWFVLEGNTLKYYQDREAEEFSQADGEISLDDIIKVSEVELSKNYGFSLNTVNEEITLAAVTSGIRRNWVNAIEKSSKAINEKENTEKVDHEKLSTEFDEKMVEKSMERRARMRQRRKMGRSRTYDFAELRSAVPATVDAPYPEKDKKSVESELHKPIPDKIKQSVPVVTVTENGLDHTDGIRRERRTSQRSKKSARSDHSKSPTEPPLTPKMFNINHWDKIENSDTFSKIISNGHPENESSKIVAACNSLKSEVEFMARQIEQGKKEFDDALDEQKQKMEKTEKEEDLKSDRKVAVEDANSDKLRTLEIAHKCAMEENKRLRDEIIQSRVNKEQETNRMNSKIRDLKAQLAMVEKRSRIKSSLKSAKNDRSLKDKVSELEAEMEDTGQMIAARLTALETPRRKETDDSDEAGSSSSCSSINQMMRLGRGDEEKSEPKKADFDTSHQKLSDSIKSLQEARSSSEYGTSAVQEAFNANKATVLSLQKKLLKDQKNWAAVKKQMQELCAKVSEVKSEKYAGGDFQNLIPYLESELNSTLQIIEKGGVSDESDLETKKSQGRDPKEMERKTLERLKTLSEQLKPTDLSSYPSSSSTTVDTGVSQALNLEIPFDQKDKLFAQQLSHEAMIIAEMAGTLERYAAGNADASSSLLHSDTQDIFPENQSAINKSGLLQHGGIVAEKILLQSRLTQELSKLQTTSNLQNVRHEFKSASLPQSVSYNRSGQGNFSDHQGMLEGTSSSSLVQAQVNYILHVYNDRIARLSQDVKEAQHRADTFQQKLVELVHACKTKDIEIVSQLALEVDTKASLASTVEDLPEWRQQVDYGMLHGAQASISSIDLQVEASFFAKLSQDISCMSSDVGSLANLGGRILELDMSISRLLKPSAIGDHASVIAYEAISQAQLLFLIRRISKDYEEQISKMKSIVKKQVAHCETLQLKLKEMENGDADKMQQLTKEHKQKVERLMQQLSLVEEARKEMTADMDEKLNKIAQKQQRDLEKSEARHKKENEKLRNELKANKARLQESEKEHKTEVEKLQKKLEELTGSYEDEISIIKEDHEKSLSKERNECKKLLNDVSSDEAKKMDKIKVPTTMRLP